MALCHLAGHGIGIAHVAVGVAVVAHHADGVLPCPGAGVLNIADALVDHGLGGIGRAHGEASHGHVGLVADEHAAALIVVHQTEVVVGNIAVNLAEGVLALIAQQEIVGGIVLPARGKHPVVPGTVAEEQQVAGHILVALRTVVEHLQVAAVGIGIGGAAGELVVEFVGGNDIHAQRVLLAVILCQTLCLCQELLRCGDDDDHIGRCVGMVVLVGDVMDVFRHGERTR